MTKKAVIILGSTGSIGTQALDIFQQLPDYFNIVALTAHQNMGLLAKQANQFTPHTIAVSSHKKKAELSSLLNYEPTIFVGKEGLNKIVTIDADICLIAIIGTAALTPVTIAISHIPHIAIANKEALVAAGSIIMDLVKKHKTTFIPVDSEHSALFQCLNGLDFNYNIVKNVTLTASGGPFWKRTSNTFNEITPEDALKHPNWIMGAKITIDSATMANKGLEVIEAHHLFNLNYDDIQVVIHPKSIVHAFVETIDGAIFSHMGRPDMRYPIQYALTYPNRIKTPFKQASLLELSNLEFLPPDKQRFPLLYLAYDCGRMGNSAPTIYNAANELAVYQFLNKQITFTDIETVIKSKLELFQNETVSSIEDIIELDLRIKKELN